MRLPSLSFRPAWLSAVRPASWCRVALAVILLWLVLAALSLLTRVAGGRR